MPKGDHIGTTTAEVYVTKDGHRFFTKRAAIKNAARLVLFEKYGQRCDCEGDGYREPISLCEYHRAYWETDEHKEVMKQIQGEEK